VPTREAIREFPLRILVCTSPRQGHTDFGGNSLFRVALGLRDLGHRVAWLTAFQSAWGADFKKRLAAEEIATIPIASMAWSMYTSDPATITRGVVEFARLASGFRPDTIVGDRLCSHLAIAARLCRTVWAAVGTDGRPWTVAPPHCPVPGSHPSTAAREVCERFRIPLDEEPWHSSAWLLSPYLNLSFMLRAFFGGSPGIPIPAHSHFVGASDRAPDPARDRKRIVLTFGNSFHPAARKIVSESLGDLARSFPDFAWTVLTGSDAATEALRRLHRDLPNLEIETWRSYQAAFPGCLASIGHGGTAFLWESFHHEVLPLLIAPETGDQLFNSRVVRELRIGGVLPLEGLSTPRLIDGLRMLTSDRSIRDNLARTGGDLRAGGGISAAMGLIEELAAGKKPVTRCPSPACCC
jgi:hypothetical protein